MEWVWHCDCSYWCLTCHWLFIFQWKEDSLDKKRKFLFWSWEHGSISFSILFSMWRVFWLWTNEITEHSWKFSRCSQLRQLPKLTFTNSRWHSFFQCSLSILLFFRLTPSNTLIWFEQKAGVSEVSKFLIKQVIFRECWLTTLASTGWIFTSCNVLRIVNIRGF